MTNSSDEAAEQGITDEQLPEDLQPSEENPLAEPLDGDTDPEDLDMGGGRVPDEWDDEQHED